jgi:decaprenylphospho-beta-D-ribofuranose 2-oxidase
MDRRIDAFTGGAAHGRGIVVGADPADVDAVPARHRGNPRAVKWRKYVSVPRRVSLPVASSVLVRRFNDLWFRRAKHASRAARPVRFDSVLMPLDAIPGWNQLYGRGGFVQYQFAVPLAGVGFLSHALERLRAARCWSCFTTLKRLGPSSGAPLSFPLEGWSLSLDIPASAPDLRAVLDELDQALIDAGGRVYLAKDSRMRADLIPKMYPDVSRLAEVRSRFDPRDVVQSNLARRLGLV